MRTPHPVAKANRPLRNLLIVFLCGTAISSRSLTVVLAQTSSDNGMEEGIPSRTIPLQFGVNIHFIEPRERDIEMIAAAGFRFIRMDFVWSHVEREKGKYDFSGYDRLVESLAKQKIRPLFILDYGTRHYDKGLAPHTDEGRAAFCKFAAAAAKHFAGKRIIWEIWNEPNLDKFWRPKANVDDYCALAVAACKAMREADPKCVVVAPATSGIPLQFLQKLFEAGALRWLDGVTVHPYRGKAPETVTPDYQKLRELLDNYAPAEKKGLPILSGEWGYSLLHFRKDADPAEKQAAYLARQFLVNLMNDVRLSIWYDWHDDGPDPNEYEHNFGTVTHTYELKPAYLAAKTLLHTLNGMRFVKRIPLESPDDYALLFSDGQKSVIAAWTTGETHSVRVPLKEERVRIISMTGQSGHVQRDGREAKIELSQNPQYLLGQMP